MFVDKREHKRYLVNGKVMFSTPFGKGIGELLSLSATGLLVMSSLTVDLYTEVVLHIEVEDFLQTLIAQGKVVRVGGDTIAVQFLEDKKYRVPSLHNAADDPVAAFVQVVGDSQATDGNAFRDANANPAFAVTDNNSGSKTHSLTTLGHTRNPGNVQNLLIVFFDLPA